MFIAAMKASPRPVEAAQLKRDIKTLSARYLSARAVTPGHLDKPTEGSIMTVVKLLRPMAVAALVLVTSYVSAQAGQEAKSTLAVTLWDKGADAEMKMDMGMGMTGDHAMSNMGLKLSQASVKAGEVTFK